MKEKNFGRTKKTLKEQTEKSMKVVVIYSGFALIDIGGSRQRIRDTMKNDGENDSKAESATFNHILFLFLLVCSRTSSTIRVYPHGW